MIQSVEWRENHVRLLDQTLLPSSERYLELGTSSQVAEAIRTMQVRGAPAIGIAAAYGIALQAKATEELPAEHRVQRIEAAIDELADTRPTAVNLFAALDRMRHKLHHLESDTLAPSLIEEALAIHDEERRATRAISQHGATLLPKGSTVLTHCNAGMIATAAYGTALGAIVEAHKRGQVSRVFATETRPLCQGARLTVWELVREGIPTTLIVDSMTAHVIHHCGITCVMVGADRIAANGDVANKIGTYGIATIARAHGVPFYVAAPLSTIDLAVPNGDHIVIEERNPDEITGTGNRRIAADGCNVYNPAFDVTPRQLVSAIVTERGIIEEPDTTRVHKASGRQSERGS